MASRWVGVLLVVGLVGCAGKGGDDDGKKGNRGCVPPDPPSLSLATNIQPIFDRSCALAGCHVGAVPAESLNLSRGESHEDTVGREAVQRSLDRIKAGDPAVSYLVQKIEGDPDIAGVLMPQGCPGNPLNGAICLSGDDIAAIRTWITECALDN